MTCIIGFAQSRPSLTGIEPASGVQATTLKVILSGSGFASNSRVAFSGPGVVVQSVRFLSSTSLEATIVLSARANTYSVTVSNDGANSNAASFSVLPGGIADASELEVRAFDGFSFHDPFHMWVSTGYAYLTDYSDSVIKQVSLSDSSVTTLAGKAGEFGAADGFGSEARFGQPAGVWSDGDNVYVTDAYFDTVRRISLSTLEVTTVAGSAHSPSGSADGYGSAARFRSPTGIWGDGTSLYVCDSLNFTVRKIEIATGRVTTVAGRADQRGTRDGGPAARFYGPMAIWGDGVNLYVADGGAIRKVSIATGDVDTLSGDASGDAYADGLASDARFSFVSGIWGDGENLFLADSGNDAIRKISIETGSVTTVAGLESNSGDTDGRGQDARFDDPSDIAGDGSAIYIVDRLNAKIKQAAANWTTAITTAQPSVNPAAPGTAPSTAPGTASGTPAVSSGTVTSGTPSGLVSHSNQLSFALRDRGGMSRATSGDGDAVAIGYGLVLDASPTPDGLAIFGYRKDGVLVSEATVPLSQLVKDGRIIAQITDAVNTGLALANPNAQTANLSFYFEDDKGAKVYSGTLDLPAGGLKAAFLNQSPFAPPSGSGISLANARTFTFFSSAPIGVTALRGFTNERADFLITTLPVVPLRTDYSPIVFAHYADGGGWKTELMLVNPTDLPVSGTAAFFSEGSSSPAEPSSRIPRQTLPYSIAPGSAMTLQLSGNSLDVRRGWIRVSPSSGNATPAGLLVFSFKANGITMTEAGIPAVPERSAFRLFVETAGDFENSQHGSMQSGFALSNSSQTDGNVNLELVGLDGVSTGFQTTLTVPAYSQIATFLNQLPAFRNVQAPFQGFLQITGAPVSVVGLRGRYNERGDFLITSTPPTSGFAASVASATSIFPYLVDGGGYTTQFILSNQAAGQESNGTLSFVGSTGSPIILPINQ